MNNAASVDYLAEFPLPAAILPARLRSLLEPVGTDPRARVDVTLQFEHDPHGPEREHIHMTMAVVSDAEPRALGILDVAGSGLVSSSTPDVRNQGELREYVPSADGHDYIVASWGSGSFFNFSLAEKVWMALGLSSRALGGEEQRLIYDDLSLPQFGVAEGNIATEYYFTSKRNVRWTISNEYLRRYLWMRGLYGARAFFYEALLPDEPEVRAVMNGQSHIVLKPTDAWYELDVREFDGGLLIQLWATVVAVGPELCREITADGLLWPGVPGAMTHNRADALVDHTSVYLDDQFLEHYEQNSRFDTVPVRVYNSWHCSPNYGGQWGFSDCVRVGRNLVRVSIRELYKPKPDREILHARSYAVDPAIVAGLDLDEEHIVSKVDRFVAVLLDLGDNIATLAALLDREVRASDLVGISRREIRANGWLHYPGIVRLAQVAPLRMSEQSFLSRCKSIHELWQRVPNGILRSLVQDAGHERATIKDLGSLKLLQALTNIVERLNRDTESADAFRASAQPDDLTKRNDTLAALFVTNELRIVDAHDAGEALRSLASLDFDPAALNDGYGHALDHVFDRVIGAFAHINTELEALLAR